MYRAKAILTALCLIAAVSMVGGSHLYMRGFNDGIASIDNDALASFVHFSKPFHAAQREQARKPEYRKHAKASPAHSKPSDPFTALAELQARGN